MTRQPDRPLSFKEGVAALEGWVARLETYGGPVIFRHQAGDATAQVPLDPRQRYVNAAHNTVVALQPWQSQVPVEERRSFYRALQHYARAAGPHVTREDRVGLERMAGQAGDALRALDEWEAEQRDG
jgi:hypothetical protein